ncbi:Ankyrin repeat family protein [Rhynchospora pubera]|uniref:Ankyrin repeat family protein n=2 Tax=Rhynchospora pubera TaxID=906938 RepID=A0AAV8CAH4_9POAL|nr:Ankyrin repeat family protein [Rhynchospora pubera]
MDTWLLKAAVSGDSNELKKMVLQDPNVNFLGTTPQGSTCLHISSIFGHEEFFKEVLARNESLLSRVNSYGETPLIVSVKSGHISLATTLLEKYKERKLSEVILNSDINGDTALHHAIRHGHKNLALQLIKTEPNLSQRVNNYNESPMYIAVMRGFVDVFKQLWESDRSSHKGPYDDNALHAAVRNANIEIIEAIMKKRPELAKEKNKSGHTPIQYAVDRNQTSVISKMLQHDLSLGYLVNGNHEGNPLLVSAASRGHVDVATEIIKHCPDAPYQNRAGLTILHQAVLEGHIKYVEFILQNRQLDKLINMRDAYGKTALHYAVKNCNPKIVRALLDHQDIDVRIYDSEGTPAFWELIDAKDSAKSLNWNEVFMLMSKADEEATPYYDQVARKKIIVKSKQEIKSLTATYTKNTSLVAILIASITFAAAFTLPGGYSNNSGTEGLPVLVRKAAFKAFLISDTLAMCSSLAVAFICILTRWEDLKFLLYYISFTKKLMWFAYMATTVAFATGLYTVVEPCIPWLAILICILSIGLPFLTYLLGKWPTLKLYYRFKFNLAHIANLLDVV